MGVRGSKAHPGRRLGRRRTRGKTRPRLLQTFTTAWREALPPSLRVLSLTASVDARLAGAVARGFPAIRCLLAVPARCARSSIGAACGGGVAGPAAAAGLVCEERPRPGPAVVGLPSAWALVLASPQLQLRPLPDPNGLGAGKTCGSHGGRGGSHCQEDGQDGAEEERGERGRRRGPGGRPDGCPGSDAAGFGPGPLERPARPRRPSRRGKPAWTVPASWGGRPGGGGFGTVLMFPSLSLLVQRTKTNRDILLF